MADLPGSFEETLHALALWFESEEIPYTTVGGMAVSLLGQPRVTQDIDVVGEISANRIRSLQRRFLFRGGSYYVMDTRPK